jgi:hypothetical protein
MAEQIEIAANIKSNIGDLSDGLDKATKSTKGLTKETNKAETATKKSTKGFKKMGTAVRGIGTALKASGLLILAALMVKLMDVFRSNQKVLDFFSTTMSALSIAFNDLFKYLDTNYETIKGYLKGLFTDPLGELAKLGLGIEKFFIQKMKGATLVLQGLWTILQNIANPKKFAEGLALVSAGTIIAGKEITAIYSDIESAVSEYTSSVIGQAEGLTALHKAARRAGVEFAMLNAQYLKDAELQRQIRDDETKTFADRIEANTKLGKVLQDQQKLQQEQIQKQVDSAYALHLIDKENLDNKIAYQETLVAQAELEETITGQQSEQKTNAVALEKELLETQNEVRAEGLSGMQRELEELEAAYKLKLEMARKSGMDTTAITKQFEKQKTEVVQANINAQLEAFSGLASGLSALAGDNKALAVASAVIDTYVGANKAFAQGGILGFVTAAGVIAAGLANVQKILSTDVGSEGGGGGPTPSATQTPAPQMMSGAFELTGAVEPEPLRAFVVTDEMTSSQNQLANIRRRATI